MEYRREHRERDREATEIVSDHDDDHDDGEWRDVRPAGTERSDAEEWRRGVQPPREDEWGGRVGDLKPATSDDGFSEQDRAALHDITGNGHVEINRTLSGGTIDQVETIADRVNAVSRALDRLPDHEGTVLRGSGGDLTEAQIARYEPGEVVIEERFTHSSTNPDVADGIFRGNVVWAIESRHGKSVEDRSAHATEHEVMFDRYTRFEVLAKERVEDTDQWLIYMREL